jgi:hypothetical protein
MKLPECGLKTKRLWSISNWRFCTWEQYKRMTFYAYLILSVVVIVACVAAVVSKHRPQHASMLLQMTPSPLAPEVVDPSDKKETALHQAPIASFAHFIAAAMIVGVLTILYGLATFGINKDVDHLLEQLNWFHQIKSPFNLFVIANEGATYARGSVIWDICYQRKHALIHPTTA